MIIHKVRTRKVTPEDANLPWVDYSVLNAIRACPMKGIVQYAAKKWPEGGRGMALESGNAFHLACAAWNLWSVGSGVSVIEKLFGNRNLEPLASMLDYARQTKSAGGDDALAFALSALHIASGFYDSPDDKKRTLANLENAIIYWAAQQKGSDYFPPVAIEIPVEMVIEITYEVDSRTRVLAVQYIGRIDKVHKGHTGLVPTDYKTTTLSLDSSYESQYVLNAQVIGYRLMMQLLYPNETISPYAVIEAIKIPVSKSDTVRSFMRKAFRADNIEFFARFIVRNYEWIKLYSETNDLRMIEQRTDNCNAYFTTCPLLSGLCIQPEDDWNAIVSELPDHEWDPHKGQV